MQRTTKPLLTRPWKAGVNKMNERVGLYSSSLYSAAKEEGCTKDLYESLVMAGGIVKENKDYVKLMTSASISSDERVGLLSEAFEKSVHPYCLNFMKMLAKKRIFDIFVPCIEEYEKHYFKDNNISRAKITTAFPLTDEKQKSVVEKIEKATGKSIIPEFIVTESIVGGIIVETESSGMDASVMGRLNEIQRHISKT